MGLEKHISDKMLISSIYEKFCKSRTTKKPNNWILKMGKGPEQTIP
jgi:hypothetical protein